MQLLARLAQKQMQIIFLIALAFCASSLPRNKRKKKKRATSKQQRPNPCRRGLRAASGTLWLSPRWEHAAGGGRLVPRRGADPVPLRFCRPQGAFPARLKKVFIVGAPMWFRVPYSIISLLLKEKLRERVSVSRGVCSPPPAVIRGPVPRLCPLSSCFVPGGFAPRVSRLFPKGMGLCGRWPRPAGCDLGTCRLLQPAAAFRSHFLPLLPS